jgi:hypothetical protein
VVETAEITISSFIVITSLDFPILPELGTWNQGAFVRTFSCLLYSIFKSAIFSKILEDAFIYLLRPYNQTYFSDNLYSNNFYYVILILILLYKASHIN